MDETTVLLDLATVLAFVRSTVCDNFGTLLGQLQTKYGRQLSRDEKGHITTALRQRRKETAAAQRPSDSVYSSENQTSASLDRNILMVTAYSDDYSIGSLCEKVNRSYAATYGYEFLSEVLSLDTMSAAISPKKHCTWYKIALLKKLFADVDYLQSKRIQYIMWIDADAIVVDHSIKLTDIITKCGSTDLIIAEDMNTGCLVNAGVFMLRTTRWSRDFINDVWDCVKYNDVTFFEQSAMIRCLRAKKEDFDSVVPFHSYLPGATQGVKLFPHTAVLPLAEFNSNKGILCNDLKCYEAFVRELQGAGLVVETALATVSVSTGEQPQTIIENNPPTPPNPPSVPSSTIPWTSSSSSSCPRKAKASNKLTVPNECYMATGNFCTLCQRTVGSNLKRAVGAGVDWSPSVFIYHPAGMPDKLTLLYAALYKYKVPYDHAADLLQADAHTAGATTSIASAVSASDVAVAAVDSVSTSIHNGSSELTQRAGESVTPVPVPVSVSVPVPAPLRLVRGKMGQIPQPDQLHLMSRMMNKQTQM